MQRQVRSERLYVDVIVEEVREHRSDGLCLGVRRTQTTLNHVMLYLVVTLFACFPVDSDDVLSVRTCYDGVHDAPQVRVVVEEVALRVPLGDGKFSLGTDKTAFYLI